MKLPLSDLGPESEKGVVAALDDLFGPTFRELGEYLADKVRLHRVRALKKILERAKEIGPAAEDYLAPPSLKFLLTFTDRASLEEADDLTDLWARLLNQAATAEKVEHLYFADVLSKLGPQEAKIIEDIALHPRIPRGAVSQISDAWYDFRPHRLDLAWEDAIHRSDSPEEYFRNFVLRVERRGARVLSLFMWANGSNDEFYSAEAWPGYDKNLMSFLLLHQLGVIHYDEQVMLEFGGEAVNCTVAYLTPLGAELFHATHDPEWRLGTGERGGGYFPDEDFISPHAEVASYADRFTEEDLFGSSELADPAKSDPK